MKLALRVIIVVHVPIACLSDTFFWLKKGTLSIQCIRLPYILVFTCIMELLFFVITWPLIVMFSLS